MPSHQVEEIMLLLYKYHSSSFVSICILVLTQESSICPFAALHTAHDVFQQYINTGLTQSCTRRAAGLKLGKKCRHLYSYIQLF